MLTHGYPLNENRPPMTRPRPAWWYRLPVSVTSGATLAAHMRGTAAQCVGASTDWPQHALLIAAALLEACPPDDAVCLQSVVADLDARAAAAPEDAVSGERRYWDALAHAVERIAESLAPRTGQMCTICGADDAVPTGHRDPDLGDVALCALHRHQELDWT